METTQNVQVFPEVSPNPISESGELLFLEENLKVFPNSPSIINPKHPRAKYFKALIESLNLNNDEGYLNNPSLDINHCCYVSLPILDAASRTWVSFHFFTSYKFRQTFYYVFHLLLDFRTFKTKCSTVCIRVFVA
jgi:hypothetical protein